MCVCVCGGFLVGIGISSFLNLFVQLPANAPTPDITRDQKKKKKKNSWRNLLSKKFTTFKQMEQASFISSLRRNSENAGSKVLRKPSSCTISIRLSTSKISNIKRQVNLWNNFFTVGPKQSQLSVDEISDCQTRNHIGLNEKNVKVTNTLRENLLHFLPFPQSSIIFPALSYFFSPFFFKFTGKNNSVWINLGKHKKRRAALAYIWLVTFLPSPSFFFKHVIFYFYLFILIFRV